VTDIDIYMRERTPFMSSLPRPYLSAPKSSIDISLADSSAKRRITGSVLTESTNSARLTVELDEVKEVEDKENVSPTLVA
jgi:hypothetical protein